MSDENTPVPRIDPTQPIEPAPSAQERLRIGIGSTLITAISLPASREAALVRTKLEEALMWLGRVQ